MLVKWVCDECCSNNVIDDSDVLKCTICGKIRTSEPLSMLEEDSDKNTSKHEKKTGTPRFIDKIKAFLGIHPKTEKDKIVAETTSSKAVSATETIISTTKRSVSDHSELWDKDNGFTLNTKVISEKGYTFIGKADRDGILGYIFKDNYENERFLPTKTCILLNFLKKENV